MSALGSDGAPSIDVTLSLIDDVGRIVDETSLHGTYTLIFFEFTHCQVVCPRALGKPTRVLDRLGPLASNVWPLYITVDPERDTPDVLRAFLREQYPRFIRVTGAREQIDNAKRAFRVFAQRRDEGAGDYVIPHTAITYVLLGAIYAPEKSVTYTNPSLPFGLDATESISVYYIYNTVSYRF